MSSSNIKLWVKAHCPGPEPHVGKPVYIVSRNNNRLSIQDAEITSIGRLYVRIRNASPHMDQVAYSLSGHDTDAIDLPYLTGEREIGFASLLFGDRKTAEDHVRCHILRIELSRNYDKWARNCTHDRLETAVLILNGAASDDTVQAALSMISHQPVSQEDDAQ